MMTPPDDERDAPLNLDLWRRSISQEPRVRLDGTTFIRKSPRGRGALVSILVIVFLGLVVWFGRDFWSALWWCGAGIHQEWQESQQWPSEPALILSSSVSVHHDLGNAGNSSQEIFRPYVIFQYRDIDARHHGRLLIGRTYSLFHVSSTVRSECDEITSRYKPGSTHSCFVDPYGHSFAVLDRSLPEVMPFLWTLAVAVMAAVGGLIVAQSVFIIRFHQIRSWTTGRRDYPLRLRGVLLPSDKHLGRIQVMMWSYLAPYFLLIFAAARSIHRIHVPHWALLLSGLSLAALYLVSAIIIMTIMRRMRLSPSVELVEAPRPGSPLHVRIIKSASATQVVHIAVLMRCQELLVVDTSMKIGQRTTDLMLPVTLLNIENSSVSSAIGSWSIPRTARATILGPRYRISWSIDCKVKTRTGDSFEFAFNFPMEEVVK